MSTTRDRHVRHCLRVPVPAEFADQLRQVAGSTGQLDALVAMCIELVVDAERRMGDRPLPGYHTGFGPLVIEAHRHERLELWLLPWQVNELRRRAAKPGFNLESALLGVVSAAARILANGGMQRAS